MASHEEIKQLGLLLKAYEKRLDDLRVETARMDDGTRFVDEYVSRDLPERKDIIDYLSDRASRRRHLRHYGTCDRIQSIVQTGKIYLSDGSRWNDTMDRNRFNPPQSKLKKFGTCFSAASNESVAMWMLYSGYDRNGAMIDFRPSTLRVGMERNEFRCGYFDGGFVPICRLAREEIEINLVDVLYFCPCEDDPSQIYLRRNAAGERRYLQSRSILSNFGQIIKNEAWSYETETRLIVTVPLDLLLSKGCSPNKAKAIEVELISKEGQGLDLSRVHASPVAAPNVPFIPSPLTSMVDWDLCLGCPSYSSGGAGHP